MIYSLQILEKARLWPWVYPDFSTEREWGLIIVIFVRKSEKKR